MYVRGDCLMVEKMDDNWLFRWFVGLNADGDTAMRLGRDGSLQPNTCNATPLSVLY
jgi:hypothetical protein